MKKLTSKFLIFLLFCACASTKKEDDPKLAKAKIYYSEGTAQLYRGEYHQALKKLRIAARLNPQDSLVQNNLGLAYYFRKSQAHAIKHFKAAINLDKNNFDARLNLGNLLMEQNKLDLAEAQFKTVLKDLVFERQHKTNFNLGILEQKRGAVTKAATYFMDSIAVNSNYCPAYFELGKIYKKRRMLKRAFKVFTDGTKGVCYEYFPNNINRAQMALNMREFQLAKEISVDLEERFSQLEQQNQIQAVKKKASLSL